MAQVEPDSAFIGNWELIALSDDGRLRPGKGLLVVAPGQPGQPATWTWDLSHLHRGDLVTTRKPGKPWPIISRHTPAPRIGSYSDHGGDGFYHLAGDTLTVVILSLPASAKPDEDIFRPAARRTIETYRRVANDPDPSFRASPFPKGPVTLIAVWDEAWHGTLQGPPRGTLHHYAAYDLGEGVRLIRSLGIEFLNDPPAADLDPKDAPAGTIVRPPGGRFDDATYEVAYPTPGPEVRAIIDSFRAQNPDVPDRRITYAGLFATLRGTGDRCCGWDGILLSTKSEGDRTIAEIVFSPRMLEMTSYGTRTLVNVRPPVLETWEFRDDKLRYLGGGPEELQRRSDASWIPPEHDQLPATPGRLRIRPRPTSLAPVPDSPRASTHVHFRPDRIDLEDSSKNSTEAPAPPDSSPEFTIHHAFGRCPSCLRPRPGRLISPAN